MAKTNTRKYLIYGSIATIVGVLAYFIWKGSTKQDNPKNDETIPEEDNNKGGKNNGGGSSVNQAEIDLAIAYRKWANSTDALKKKWGALSIYKLDETGSTPNNSYFASSYNGGGKAEYEAYLKESKQPVSSDNKNIFNFLINQNTNAITTSVNGIRRQTLYFSSWGYRRAVLELREQTSLTDKKPYWSIYPTEADKKAKRGLIAQGYWSANPTTKEFTFKSTSGLGAGREKTNKLIATALQQVLGTEDFKDIKWVK